jgi:hypothetical protein
MATTTFEKAVEQMTGETIENLRRTPIDERREALEKASGKPTHFVSRFPLIGRGNVLRKRLVSREKVEKDFWEALNDE